MSSRKLLVYINGLLIDSRTTNGWFARQVRVDVQDEKAEQAAYQERLLRAEQKAQIEGQPMQMADLLPPTR